MKIRSKIILINKKEKHIDTISSIYEIYNTKNIEKDLVIKNKKKVNKKSIIGYDKYYNKNNSKLWKQYEEINNE